MLIFLAKLGPGSLRKRASSDSHKYARVAKKRAYMYNNDLLDDCHISGLISRKVGRQN